MADQGRHDQVWLIKAGMTKLGGSAERTRMETQATHRICRRSGSIKRTGHTDQPGNPENRLIRRANQAGTRFENRTGQKGNRIKMGKEQAGGPSS